VEARLRPSSTLLTDRIRQLIAGYIQEAFAHIEVDAELEGWEDVDMLRRELDRVWVGDACECCVWCISAASGLSLRGERCIVYGGQ
jgi:hypothetical protein